MRMGQKLTVGFIAIVSVVGIIGYTSIIQLNKIARPLDNDIPESVKAISRASHLDRSAQLVRYYDEVLTQSARNYAFTQDKRWERRYRNVEGKLDEIIKEVIERANEEDKEIFSSVHKANLALVKMEYESIKLVNNGQAELAVRILESSKYWNQKEIYKQGLINYVHRRGDEYDETLLASTETIGLVTKQAQYLTRTGTLLVSIFAVVALMLTAGISIFISRCIDAPFAKLKGAIAEIGKGDLDTRIEIKSNDEIGELAQSLNDMTVKLKESHGNPDQRVEQQTTELSSANAKVEREPGQQPSTQGGLQCRVKQLDCLYGLSRLIEQPQTSLGQIFQEATRLIRNAYQYPDLTCARITFDGIPYKTDNFDRSELSQYAQIRIRGEEAGTVEVYYLGEKDQIGEDPFLEEEHDLLDAVAEHLSTVAERKQTGDRLQLFQSLIDRSNDCIFVIEPKWGRFLDVNERACNSLGYTREEFLDMTVKNIDELIPDDTSWHQRVSELKVKGDIIEEGRYRRKDATTLLAEVSLKYVIQKEKNYIIAIARNITERKRADEKIRKQQELLTNIISNIPHSVFWKNRESVYLGCNENFSRVAGAGEPDDIVGKTDYDLAWKKDEADWFVKCDKEVVESGKTLLDVEEQQLQADGKEATLLTSRVPLYDGEGNVIGLLGIYADITERKQAEDTVAMAYAKLETANTEMKEMQSQMVQNEKLAAIGQLAAGVAHEMNTPVGFVASNFQTLVSYVKKFRDLLVMYGELAGGIGSLQKKELIEKASTIKQSWDNMKIDFILEDIQELFDDSKEGLERVTTIVQNLRDFSRIDQAEDFAEYNINDGIEATLVVAKNEIKYNTNVEMEFSEVPPVFCNSGQVNQVFLNVLMNAAQAIKSQGRDDKGTITIKTYAMDNEVVCEISDDGPGIAADKLSKVFDPFFTTKPVGKGTGLGLSVSYDIVVNKHKGQLLAESTVGKGAKFIIKLPLEKEKTSNKQEIDKSSKNIKVKT